MKWIIEKGAASTVDHARCTRRSALTAARNVKFRSSRQRAARSTARSATPSTGHREGSKPDSEPQAGYARGESFFSFFFINRRSRVDTFYSILRVFSSEEDNRIR